MKRYIIVICSIFLFAVIVIFSGNRVLASYQAQTQQPQTVDINGTASWATSPTGPDFQGVTLIPFQAQNPTRETWQRTQNQIAPYLSNSFDINNIQVSTSGVITGAPNLVNDFSEVMVYLDPTNPDHLLGASKFFYLPAQYLFYTGVFESFDAGLTWSELQPEGVSDYSLTSDPVTTFDELGNGYFTLLTRGPTGLDMLKKQPGQPWELPVVVDRTTGTDKQWIMGDQDPQSLSPYAGNLYMSWTSFSGPVTGIVFSRSTDRNTSWSSPISLTGGDIQGSVPGVAPDGTVYVVFGRHIFYGPDSGTIEFVKSSDGGVIFTSSQTAADITSIPYELPDPFNNPIKFRSPASLPAFAVSPTNGNLYIAWADYRNGDSDIYFASSSNGGDGWTDPVRLNDDPISNGIDQFQPQVSVAANGRVAVMWFDRRLPCPDLPWIPESHVGKQNACIDTFVTRSYDDGSTWTVNARASAQTWDWTLNLPIDGGGNGFIGDYQGIASSNVYDFPFWDTTANLGKNDVNYQEVFVARLPVPYFNLSASSMQVNPHAIQPGGELTYTVSLNNLGLDEDPNVVFSDTIPISTTYITGSLTFPSGSGRYDPIAKVISWSGGVDAGTVIPIQFKVAVSPSALPGETITNTAVIWESSGKEYSVSADAVVDLNPVILATSPSSGDVAIPITSTIVVTFSQPMNTSSLAYSVLPNPGGWQITWNDVSTSLRMTHKSFDYSQPYTVTITADDVYGLPLAAGPVPNPWSFTTQLGPPPEIEFTIPADEAISVPVTQTITILFSEPVISSTLVYTLTPAVESASISWNHTYTKAILTPVEPLAYNLTYTVQINVEDKDGFSLIPGPAANPWSFSTMPQSKFDLLLPIITR